MDNEHENKLAELIHRELAQLPERRAPETLLPRVLARLEQQRRSWWRRPWLQWPFTAKLLSLPFMIGSAGAFVLGLSQFAKWRMLESASSLLTPFLEPLLPFWEWTMVAANILAVAVRSIEMHWLLLAGAAAFSMYLSCLALGTVAFRVAVAKR